MTDLYKAIRRKYPCNDNTFKAILLTPTVIGGILAMFGNLLGEVLFTIGTIVCCLYLVWPKE